MTDIGVGRYLFERIKQLGIKSIFGVPGDYELTLLDVIPEAGLDWKGNPNELVASYAADGYGRIAGAGAFVTTFGPGELSALCGIAGAYCEFVPVAHIVGYPSVKFQNEHAVLHHTVGDGRYELYHEMSKQISCATTVLKHVKTAATEIDRCLNAMMYHRQPVYIGVPVNMVNEKISSSGLEVPLTTTLSPNDESLEQKVLQEIRKRLETHESAVIIVDGGAIRHDVLGLTQELVDVTNLPFFTTPMGKGALDEQQPRYGGFYGGAVSKEDCRVAVESAQCVLWIGNYPSDINTAEFTEKVKPEVVIDFERFFVMIGGQRYDVKMNHVLRKLVDSLRSHPLNIVSGKAAMPCKPLPDTLPTRSKEITQAWYWTRCGQFFREGDLIITETGTSATGMIDASLPNNSAVLSQTIFGSIGWATGTSVGAFVAVREISSKFKRCLLFTGEGSLQLTIQAFSDLLRHEVKPIIFVLNNGGYTIERVLHGPHAKYNNVPLWEYTDLLHALGPEHNSKSYQVRTPEEVDRLFDDPTFNACETAQLVEVFMDPLDAPMALKMSGANNDKFNVGQ
ncbi:hypothetical protein MMC17_007547 [Xylographa soralifera]|nr:hypothetical protein [Xylographa soralifera]